MQVRDSEFAISVSLQSDARLDLILHVMRTLGYVRFASSGLHPHGEQVIKQGQNYMAEAHTGTTLHSHKILFNLWIDCMNTG